MRKSFIMVVLAVVAVLLLLPLLRPRESAAASTPQAGFSPMGDPTPALPAVQAPFDTTPITPVESAGAPWREEI